MQGFCKESIVGYTNCLSVQDFGNLHSTQSVCALNATLLGCLLSPSFFHLSPCASRRLEQERSALQKKLKARGVTADQVMGVRSTQMEEEMEELKRKNAELETQIVSIR